MLYTQKEKKLPATWWPLSPASLSRADATANLSETYISLSLLYTLSSEHPAPVLPVVTPVKDFARAKTVTSTVWNKTFGRPLRANLQMNPREFCETGIKIVPGGRLTTNPYLLCILHWQGVN